MPIERRPFPMPWTVEDNIRRNAGFWRLQHAPARPTTPRSDTRIGAPRLHRPRQHSRKPKQWSVVSMEATADAE
jgi:hypothetical protein